MPSDLLSALSFWGAIRRSGGAWPSPPLLSLSAAGGLFYAIICGEGSGGRFGKLGAWSPTLPR
jgi:hypothetical protein